MSKRLEILQNSLAKKNDAFDARLSAHFDDVKGAQGEPMQGHAKSEAAVRRWDRQNDALRSLNKGIEKTKAAIEREQSTIKRVEQAVVHPALLDAVARGEITQWRKFPNRFFVVGVEKGRIIWDEKTNKLLVSFVNAIPKDQFPLFKEVALRIKSQIEA